MPAGAAKDLFDDELRTRLERDALAPYLQRQRWFGGKAREITSAFFIDWAPLSAAPVAWLTIVEVRYGDGTVEQYQLPLALLSTAAASAAMAERPDSVLARVSGGGDDRAICDAVMDDPSCRAIVHAVWQSADMSAAHGRIAGRAIVARPPDMNDRDMAVVRLPGVHSNSAIAIGGRYLLKLFRRIEPGINPDVEIGQFLARSGADVHIPALIGTIEYHGNGGVPATLTIMQQLVTSRMNAWEHALEALATFFAAASAQAGPPSSTAVRKLAGTYVDAIALLGRRTAELHCALASSTSEADFVPEHTSDAEVRMVVARIGRQAAGVLDRLASRVHAFDDETRVLARQVIDRRQRLLARLERLGDQVRPFVRIRIHGDYHLGQVLRVHDDFVIIDFEGEPARPLEERRAKQSPLRDIAGMLRSLSYAAQMGLAAASDEAATRARLAPWARGWETATSHAFLAEYAAVVSGAAFIPPDSPQFQLTLEMFVIEKALYELDYELNNRPDWVSVPLTGILDLTGFGSGAAVEE